MVSKEIKREREGEKRSICYDAQFHVNFSFIVTFSTTHLEYSNDRVPKKNIPKNCRTTKYPPMCTLSLKLYTHTQNESHFRVASHNTFNKKNCYCMQYGKKIALIYAAQHIPFRGSEANVSVFVRHTHYTHYTQCH